MKHALITGVAGQDGIHVARLLRSRGWRVTGTIRPGTSHTSRIAAYLGDVDVVEHDITDGAGFATLLERIAPDTVYNLAGFSSVARSWDDAELVARTNLDAVVSMLEAIVRRRDSTSQDIRFFQASSAEVFGNEAAGALDENTPHRPRSPYAVAKSAAHHSVASYREKYGLYAVNGILFNHESPVRGRAFVAGRISRAAAEAARGEHPQLTLGGIDFERDWGSAVDYAEAIVLSLDADKADDYVVATGTTHTLRQMMTVAFATVGLSDPTPYVTIEPSLWSPTQATTLRGDPSRAKLRLGWTSSTSFEELISDMVHVDIRRIRSGVDDSADYLTSG